MLELLADGRARLLRYSWHVRFEGTPGFRHTEPMPDVGRWAVRDHILQLQLNDGSGDAPPWRMVGLRNPAGQIGLFFAISNSMTLWSDGNWRNGASSDDDITVADPGDEPADHSSDAWWRWAYRTLNLRLARDPATWLSRVPAGLDVSAAD